MSETDTSHSLPARDDGLGSAAPPDLGGGICNVISVDVEDYYQAEVFARAVPRASWGTYTSRVEANTLRLLELFAERRVEATFFVLGWVAEHSPALVRDIAACGHELACHSYWHRLIYQLDRNEFREDTLRAKNAIEQAAGQPVLGYRAPTYSICSRSLWALEVLAELGFEYDSSIFPIHHDRYGIPEAPRFPFRVVTRSGPLLEFPLTTFRLWGNKNLPVGGGGYLRLLPEWYTRMGLRRAQAETLPVICYVHPWEIDPDQPRIANGLASRLRHYTNLKKTYSRVSVLLREHRFTSFRNSGLQATAREISFRGAPWQ